MPQPSGSFGLLHPTIQQWIWQKNWNELRDAQEKAIPIILDGKRDIIISAATASGKTEAAFLPIASRLLDMRGEGLALYISPLKALINDQFLRMEDLFGACNLPVHPWHGDIAASRKSSFEKAPCGALLITPESLESIFVRRGFYIPSLFRLLSVVVVDELHSFINTERGFQLASLLCRLETALKRRVPRVGLSATLGDMRLAAEFLRSGEASETEIISSSTSGHELKIIIKGYQESRYRTDRPDGSDQAADQGSAAVAISRDMMKAFRGSKNLAFANSRRRVEEFTDRLVRLCEAESMPAEFCAHHGSLSKSLREEVEAILKESNRPATAICTSTLEMGIDIGQVKSVAQLDSPFSVASLRQRLGRSGRRGEAAILRMFVTESEQCNDLAPQDALRLGLFQAVAVTNLLLAKWCEPAAPARLHLSTLIQQVLSLIAQCGGLTAKAAWKITCGEGPFRNVDPPLFARLLRGLADREILMQSADGTLLHAPKGEQIVNHYSFYTAFWAPEEFKLFHGTNLLGTLPVTQPIPEKSLLLFGGRRWRVLQVDEAAKLIEVVPAQGGRAPLFSGGSGRVHGRIHEEMCRLYQGDDFPIFLDEGAKTLLKEGREQFRRSGLNSSYFIPFDGDTLVFFWAGDLVADTILVQLQSQGYTGLSYGVGLLIEKIKPNDLRAIFEKLVRDGPPDPIALADSVPNRQVDRYDALLPDDLLSQNYASGELDTALAWRALTKIVGSPRL